jgi:hypothetical protein
MGTNSRRRSPSLPSSALPSADGVGASPSPDRVRALRASLRNMLEDETVRRGLDQRGRLEWLSEQLEHYVERWLGFAAVPAVPESALMKGDLFAMVEAGAGAVAEELSAVVGATDTMTGWRRFLAELAAVSKRGDLSEPQRLRSALAEARAGFALATW